MSTEPSSGALTITQDARYASGASSSACRLGAVAKSPLSFMPNFASKFVNYVQGSGAAIRIVGQGSSVGVGATLPDPATQAPVNRLGIRINQTLDKLGIHPFTVNNQSVNGSTLNDGLSIFASTILPLQPDLVFDAFGMNDGMPAQFNSGETFGRIGELLRSRIIAAQEAGVDVLLTTTPHPHTGRVNWSLPAEIPMYYPAYMAPPVPESALIPAAANSSVMIPWHDGMVPASHRHLRVNEVIRNVAAETGCLVLDVEKYWFDALLVHELDDLFLPGEYVHPNLLGHKLSYWAAIEDLVAAFEADYSSGAYRAPSNVLRRFYDLSAPTPLATVRRGGARLFYMASQSGIGLQVGEAIVRNDGANVAVTTLGTNGPAVVTVDGAGSQIRFTPAAANTDVFFSIQPFVL